MNVVGWLPGLTPGFCFLFVVHSFNSTSVVGSGSDFGWKSVCVCVLGTEHFRVKNSS